MKPCSLYRVWLAPLHGYVVYRHCFDDRFCAVGVGAWQHKTAIFDTELEATDYADYRNRMADKNGSDEIKR